VPVRVHLPGKLLLHSFYAISHFSIHPGTNNTRHKQHVVHVCRHLGLCLCVFTCQASSYSILLTQSVTAAFTPAQTTLGTNNTSCMCVGIWACACACSPARQARTTGSVSGHGDHRRPAGVLFLVKVIQCCNLV